MFSDLCPNLPDKAKAQNVNFRLSHRFNYIFISVPMLDDLLLDIMPGSFPFLFVKSILFPLNGLRPKHIGLAGMN